MRIKICGIQNEEELAIAINSGCDTVGFQVGQLHSSKSFILPSTASRLMKLLPPYITPVLVTHLATAEDILGIANHAEIYNIQLHNIEFSELCRLRDQLPENGKIILTVYPSMLGMRSWVDEAFPLLSAINFDVYHNSPAEIGISDNNAYDWDLCRDFIKRALVPVMICGHLESKNVAEAIRLTNPFGVDVCSGVKKSGEDFFCDPLKCLDFVEAVRLAELDKIARLKRNLSA